MENNDGKRKVDDGNAECNNKQQHHNHSLMMILCLIPMGLVMYFAYFDSGKFSGSSWYWILFLICPLMHLIMMRGMHGNKHHEKEHQPIEEMEEKS